MDDDPHKTAEEYLEQLRNRPVIEFVGGRMDGSRLPVVDDCNLLGFRIDSEDGTVSVIDSYCRDPHVKSKFRHQGRTLLSDCPHVQMVDEKDIHPKKPKSADGDQGGGESAAQ